MEKSRLEELKETLRLILEDKEYAVNLAEGLILGRNTDGESVPVCYVSLSDKSPCGVIFEDFPKIDEQGELLYEDTEIQIDEETTSLWKQLEERNLIYHSYEEKEASWYDDNNRVIMGKTGVSESFFEDINTSLVEHFKGIIAGGDVVNLSAYFSNYDNGFGVSQSPFSLEVNGKKVNVLVSGHEGWEENEDGYKYADFAYSLLAELEDETGKNGTYFIRLNEKTIKQLEEMRKNGELITFYEDEVSAPGTITGQQIGEATYDTSTLLCQEEEHALDDLTKKREKGDVEQNDQGGEIK